MKYKKAKHFRVIGLKPYFPDLTRHHDLDLEKVGNIHKALSENYGWYMLIDGFEVARDNNSVTLTPEAKKDFSLYDSEDLKISVSAVVGRNGAGKSSLIELFVRAVNNLSAVLLGERFNFAAAEHLHFIDDVYVDVLFQIENTIYLLCADGRSLILRLFKQQSSFYRFDLWNQKILCCEGLNKKNNPLKPYPQGKRLLRQLFYTLVCNYSLYGFNYRDYMAEVTPAERLNKLKIKASADAPGEESVWLNGIFHKNDGYQTPIVLHPMREGGQLNIVKENKLAKERMLSLLFYKDVDGNYPMRTINDTLFVDEIRYRLTSNFKFKKENMLQVLGIKSSQNVAIYFDNVYAVILSFCDSVYGIFRFSERSYFAFACDYIVYKTLKIILNYKKYHPIFRFLSLKDFDATKLPEKLTPLFHDKSHITRKLRQTINYIINPRFNPEDGCADIENFERIDSHEDTYLFLPPPIFETELILLKEFSVKEEIGVVEFNTDDRAVVHHAEIGGMVKVPFSGLSSGERQIAYTISNILYHMVNVDSEWDDDYRGDGRTAIIQYRYMNLILDEVELYFHPEMQRRFLFLLIQAIKSVRFRNLRGVNIIFATHSPFILSDIPQSNVLKLGFSDGKSLNTFGGNIMEMLCNTFFMDSSIGELARREIVKIANFDKQVREIGDNEELKSNYKELYKKMNRRFK